LVVGSKLKKNLEDLRVILATDCGSTTSKARLFMKIGDEYRYIASGESPTTVEAPFEDVTLGVRNAIREVEELTGHKFLANNGIITPSMNENEGPDLYVTTSSAGGGLQMLVVGVMKIVTAESAERAALGAGAIVMDVMAYHDGRRFDQRVARIRQLRPDMILLAGGTDGGTTTHVAHMADMISSAKPKARLGMQFRLPLVYAGNKAAGKYVQNVMEEDFALSIVQNIRPEIDIENSGPARDAIHNLFMEHVMAHAPGYDKLMKWTDIPIMPTPAGEGRMFQTLAEVYHENVIGVGLGGATTNVYSVYDGKFVRTVSANLGMSYSICNVLKEAGAENIIRWLPFSINADDLRDILFNKMIRPTIIPQTLEKLLIEHAVAREALRLGFQHHKFLARPLAGVKRQKDISEIVSREAKTFGETYIDMLKIGWLVGTGGLLSHAPRRSQSALILLDGFQPEGVTKLAQDSVFMIPHLGVLSAVHPRAAIEIFEKDCIVRLGTCIAPRGEGKEGEEVLRIKVKMPDGTEIDEKTVYGTIKRIELREGEKAQVEIKPARGFDVGAGNGHMLATTVEGGTIGIIIDARGRPLILPDDDEKRRKKVVEWFSSLDVYSENVFESRK